MECSHIPTTSYAEFSRQLHDKLAGKRVPIGGSLELTFGCNLRCAHCYLGDLRTGIRSGRELRYPEICGLLDQIVDEGCLWLLLTGGEPLLRPDFLDIYTYAKRKGLLVTLFTNGTLITPEMADRLQEWRPFVVEITLYGATIETYEAVTGVPGSYERCLRGIELLLERNIPLKLKTMVITLNKHEIWAMKAYAEDLGVDFRFDALINAGLDGSKRPTEFRISPQEVIGFDLADEKRGAAWRDFCGRFWGRPSDQRHLFVCGAGIGSFHIDAFGQLSICMTYRGQRYDLRQGSFRDGWRHFVPGVRYQEPRGEYGCLECEIVSLCGQCPGWSLLEHGDLQTPVGYLCQVAQLRAQAFGPQAPRT
jgi:radical SAM protein with 4Fe4S-binding SPASM domain